MSVRITAAERDALYEQVFARLSGIDEVWTSAQAGDFARADETAREFSDYLRLILDDLGWGEGSGKALELLAPQTCCGACARDCSAGPKISGRWKKASAPRGYGAKSGRSGCSRPAAACWRSCARGLGWRSKRRRLQ